MKLRSLKRMKKDKRGIMGIVFFFLAIFTILIIGFIGVMAVAIVDFGSDTITPIMEDLGVIGATNFTEASEATFGTTDTIVQALPWLLTFTYVAMLIFSIIFVVTYQFNPHPAYIGIYFLFVVLLIFGAIVMSNIYEDIYLTSNSDIGDRIREQTAMSFLILHSPKFLTVIAFIVGIYIFANRPEQGGFNV